MLRRRRAGFFRSEIKNRILAAKFPRIKSCLLRTGPKKLRAADFSWEAPPSPVRTSISSSAIIAHRLRHKRHSVPPKESNACFNFVRGCLPQSLHSPQFSEPDPIYPYLPFLFWFFSLAMTVPSVAFGPRGWLFLTILVLRAVKVCA